MPLEERLRRRGRLCLVERPQQGGSRDDAVATRLLDEAEAGALRVALAAPGCFEGPLAPLVDLFRLGLGGSFRDGRTGWSTSAREREYRRWLVTCLHTAPLLHTARELALQRHRARFSNALAILLGEALGPGAPESPPPAEGDREEDEEEQVLRVVRGSAHRLHAADGRSLVHAQPEISAAAHEALEALSVRPPSASTKRRVLSHTPSGDPGEQRRVRAGADDRDVRLGWTPERPGGGLLWSELAKMDPGRDLDQFDLGLVQNDLLCWERFGRVRRRGVAMELIVDPSADYPAVSLPGLDLPSLLLWICADAMGWLARFLDPRDDDRIRVVADPRARPAGLVTTVRRLASEGQRVTLSSASKSPSHLCITAAANRLTPRRLPVAGSLAVELELAVRGGADRFTLQRPGGEDVVLTLGSDPSPGLASLRDELLELLATIAWKHTRSIR